MTEIPKGEIPHNLTRIMVAVMAENERSNELHGNWDDDYCYDQRTAIKQEFKESVKAYKKNDIYGEHGEVNELIQLMNVCAKRILYLSRQERDCQKDHEWAMLLCRVPKDTLIPSALCEEGAPNGI